MQLTEEQKTIEAKFKKAFDRAKIQMMRTPGAVFFTSVLFSLRHKIDWNHITAATNGVWVWYNPSYFIQLTEAERIFLMMHEAMHVAYEHMGRVLGRKFKLWNFATDYVINLQLVKKDFTMPKGLLLDYRFEGMSADKVYRILENELQNNSPMANPMGDDLQAPPSDMEPDEFREHIRRILVDAQIRSQEHGEAPGSIPGDLEILLQNLRSPKLPWTTILSKWVNAKAKNDYSWMRPNRRAPAGILLPGMYSEKLGHLAVAVDTSASVSDEDFSRIIGNVASIFRVARPQKITLIQFDDGIQKIDELRNLADLSRVKFHGRGGTNIDEVVEWANKHRPTVLLWFTDGYFHWPKLTYAGSKTCWLIHDNPRFTAPYGKVVHYDMAAA